MANVPRVVQRWGELEQPDPWHGKMPKFREFYDRWTNWANGTPTPVVHRGTRHPGTGGVTDTGVDPWNSADLVPGDSIVVDGGPPKDYLEGVDGPIRRSVDLINRHVGATVASCAGHQFDDRNNPSRFRFFRIVAGTPWEADKVTRAVTEIASNARLDSGAPAVDVRVTGMWVDADGGEQFPMVNVYFMPTASGQDAYYAQLPRATDAFNTAIGRFAARRHPDRSAELSTLIAPVSLPGQVRGVPVPALAAPPARVAVPGLDTPWRDRNSGPSPTNPPGYVPVLGRLSRRPAVVLKSEIAKSK